MEKLKKNLILISEDKPTDSMTTEAYYRMLHILRPLCNVLLFMPVRFYPEMTRVANGTIVIKGIGIKDIVLKLRKLDATYMFWYGGSLRMGLSIIVLKILKPNSRIIIRIDGNSTAFYKKKVRSAVSFINKFKYLRLYLLHRIAEIVIYNMVRVIAYQYEGLIEDYDLQKYSYKMMVANQYIDLDKFKSEVPFKDRYYDLGYIGRIDGGKGVVEFIQALKELKRWGINPKVIIAGEGDRQDDVLKAIEECDLLNNVYYVGKLPVNEVPKQMNQIKYLVLPSYREGIPKVVIEAMACGCIPITSEAGGLKRLISDGVNGYVIKRIDADGIASCIYRALNNQGKAESIRSTFNKLLEYYTLETTRKRYEKILEVANGSK